MVSKACSLHPNVLSAQCPTRQVLDLIADKWTTLVIYLLSRGRQRYGDLHRQIGGISQKMLTQTLRKLERDGLVSPPRLSRGAAPHRVRADGPWPHAHRAHGRPVRMGGRPPGRAGAGPQALRPSPEEGEPQRLSRSKSSGRSRSKAPSGKGRAARLFAEKDRLGAPVAPSVSGVRRRGAGGTPRGFPGCSRRRRRRDAWGPWWPAPGAV